MTNLKFQVRVHWCLLSNIYFFFPVSKFTVRIRTNKLQIRIREAQKRKDMDPDPEQWNNERERDREKYIAETEIGF